MSLLSKVVKRNGTEVDYDAYRIFRAVELCYESLDEKPVTPAADITNAVEKTLIHQLVRGAEYPSVEKIQDVVEQTLMAHGEFEAARHYILYREEHASVRVVVPAEVKAAFDISANYFATPLQQFMFFDKYSRYNWELGRRETWPETVDRVVDYLVKLSDGRLGFGVYDRIRQAILHMDVMPSMRSLSQAGPSAERNSMGIYNCSYFPVKDINAFPEAMLISMGGCGVGYSVERQYVEQFPRVQRQTKDVLGTATFIVKDTTEGWADALLFGIETWMKGFDVEFDTRQLRRAGAPLLTKGGRASGPEPLEFALDFCRRIILSRQGTFLRTLDVHDMMCVVCGVAVSGGVRRTAAIALFDVDDELMRTCKDGGKLDANPWRWNANNSAVWPDTIDQVDLIKQFTEMYENHRGEPGIFSRKNANATKPRRRESADFGSNPCGEINLRPFELCNLSIAVARADDTYHSLWNKVEIATIIGTIQSLATTFPGMREEWKINCEEERLLGVDISGQRDCPLIDASLLEQMKATAVATNEKYADLLGIAHSTAVTCNKPNGNSSQLLNCASGIHTRWAPYYIRNCRVSPHTPIFQVLKTAGVPMDPENGQTVENATSWVVHFPVKAPDGAMTRKDVTAIEQCEWWLMNKLHWTEHNPSVTITYQPEELLDLVAWVWNHRDVIGGMAFLPADDAQYAQMPYEEIDKEEYERRMAEFPEIDFSLIYAFEHTDMTEAAQTLSCAAGQCEI